jgi:hypothetical protein
MSPVAGVAVWCCARVDTTNVAGDPGAVVDRGSDEGSGFVVALLTLQFAQSHDH